MENLRTGIGLQAYGQRDPLVAYRSEGRKMFLDLMKRMQYDVVHTLFHVAVNQPPASETGRGTRGNESASPMRTVNNPQRNKAPESFEKVGRNSACPCGSGKKYKRCHGANA
jgi:preprotein translocase subunit SecA